MGQITIGGKTASKPFPYNGKMVKSLTINGVVCTLNTSSGGGGGTAPTPPAGAHVFPNGFVYAGTWPAGSQDDLTYFTTTSDTNIDSSKAGGHVPSSTAVTYVSIPWVTEYSTAYFHNMPSIRTVVMENVVTFMHNSFANAALDTLYLPKCQTIDTYSFYTAALTSLDSPEIRTIGEFAFYSSPLTSLSLPKCTTIGRNTFYSSKLTSLDLPECTTIGDSAFSESPITSLNLPKITHVGNNAFKHLVNQPTTIVTIPLIFKGHETNLFGHWSIWNKVTFKYV